MVTAFEMKFQQINLIVSPNNQTVPRFFLEGKFRFHLRAIGNSDLKTREADQRAGFIFGKEY